VEEDLSEEELYKTPIEDEYIHPKEPTLEDLLNYQCNSESSESISEHTNYSNVNESCRFDFNPNTSMSIKKEPALKNISVIQLASESSSNNSDEDYIPPSLRKNSFDKLIS
jgi:hypothetical protein